MLSNMKRVLSRGLDRVLGRPQRNIFYHQTSQTLVDGYIQQHLYQNPRYQNEKRLTRYEHQFFSQSGEDGIVNEIFNRIGTSNKYFVEFGVGNGMENNTTNLLNQGWRGSWIEYNQKSVTYIQDKFKCFINGNALKLSRSLINAENIEDIFKKLNVPTEFDFLSIDIDRNDYWVWRSISSFSPRVVVIEYNPLPGPSLKWVVKYDPQALYDGSSYYGSSLKSLELLGAEKGYKLVGCNFCGVNAFFIREDLLGDKFMEPFTSENHYEPARYFLLGKNGHRREIGEFLNI